VRLLLDKRIRQRCRVHPAPPHLAQIGALPLVERVALSLGLGHEVGDLRRGEMLMADHPQGRELLRSGRGPACWHHRCGVPVEHRDRSLNRSDPAK